MVVLGGVAVSYERGTPVPVPGRNYPRTGRREGRVPCTDSVGIWALRAPTEARL